MKLAKNLTKYSGRFTKSRQKKNVKTQLLTWNVEKYKQ